MACAAQLLFGSPVFAQSALGQPPEFWCVDAACLDHWPTPEAGAEALVAGFIANRRLSNPEGGYFRTASTVCYGRYADTVQCYAGVSYTNSLGFTGPDNWTGRLGARCPVVDGVRPSMLGGVWPDSYCPGLPPEIILIGGSSTKALIAGPALPQIARVTQNGMPVSGKSVTIAVQSGGSIAGTTGSGGEFSFVYLPPHRKTTDRLSGTCGGCRNTAQKDITVAACEVCGGPGASFGNPINAVSGEKMQEEADWVDHAPHGIGFTRHYRSLGNVPSGLGSGWAHDYAAVIAATDLDAVVTFGTGRSVVFSRGQLSDPWRTSSGNDALVDVDGGRLFHQAADESRWLFDATGKLLTITTRNGWVLSLTYAGNQLTAVTNQFGRALQFGYDSAGRLFNLATPDGTLIGYTYDAASRLSAVIFADGKSRTYHYEDTRWPQALTGITDEAGVRFATFTYDAAGLAIGTQHAGGADNHMVEVQFGTSQAGRLLPGSAVDPGVYQGTVKVTDPLGTAQTFRYQGGNGRVMLVGASGAFQGGKVESRSFAGDLVESEADFLGVRTAYTWDPIRELKTGTTSAAGRPEAQSTSTEWHPVFRLPLLVSEAGRTTAYAYDDRGNQLSETVTDTATGQARTTRWTFNAQGLLETMTEPGGGMWRYGYDAAGHRTSVQDPLGQRTTYAHDGAGRVISQLEPNGLATSYAYDRRGRIVSRNRGGEISSFSYTAAGQLAGARLPNGYEVSYAYDDAQRLVGTSDNRGTNVQYTRDGMGNAVREEIKDGNGSTALAIRRVIDSQNRVVAVQGAGGQTTAMGYDANGEIVSVTDPLQQATRQTLDGLRRPIATVFADNSAASQGWNQLDQLTHVSDPKGVLTSYRTNALGDVVAESSPDIGAMSFGRDANGAVASITDANGSTSLITRDALGRPVQISHGGRSQNFGYDAAGNVVRIEDDSGTTSYVRDPQGRALGKTQVVLDNPGSPSELKLTYGYEAGDLASIGYPSGLKVFYRRTAGRVTGIDVQEPPNAAGKAAAGVTRFIGDLAHTALGQPKAWNWKSGDRASRSFDGDGRMTQSEIASYSWDAASRITGITQSLWAQRTVTSVVGTTTITATQLYQVPIAWSAGYDRRNRLTSFARSGAETRYTYDANSNRLTAVDVATSDVDLEGAFDLSNFTTSANQTLEIEATSNRLLGFSQNVNASRNGVPQATVTSRVNYTLDANGALTSDGLRTFEYDASRRLAKVKLLKDGEAAAVEYLHNALGQRVFKSEPQVEQTLPAEDDLGPGFLNWLRKQFGWLFSKGQASKARLGLAFVYDENANLLGEYDNGTALGRGRTEYIWLPTEDGRAIPVGLYRNGKFYQVHSDHLGTPRLVTDGDNRPVWQWPYSAFGNNKTSGALATVAAASGPGMLKATKPPVEVNLRLPGQYFDQESNLSYNYFRTYQASQGRYTQPDPIGLGGGGNRFAYADQNTISNTDPLGLATLMCISPLHALTHKFGQRPAEWAMSNVPMAHHQYVCVPNGKGGMKCGGQDQRGEKLLDPFWGPGKKSDDSFNAELCKEVVDDNQCIEQCIGKKLDGPRPTYGIPLATDCQEWAQEVVDTCKFECSSSKPTDKPFVGYPGAGKRK